MNYVVDLTQCSDFRFEDSIFGNQSKEEIRGPNNLSIWLIVFFLQANLHKFQDHPLKSDSAQVLPKWLAGCEAQHIANRFSIVLLLLLLYLY